MSTLAARGLMFLRCLIRQDRSGILALIGLARATGDDFRVVMNDYGACDAKALQYYAIQRIGGCDVHVRFASQSTNGGAACQSPEL